MNSNKFNKQKKTGKKTENEREEIPADLGLPYD
jgi:hypothetical protein